VERRLNDWIAGHLAWTDIEVEAKLKNLASARWPRRPRAARRRSWPWRERRSPRPSLRAAGSARGALDRVAADEVAELLLEDGRGDRRGRGTAHARRQSRVVERLEQQPVDDAEPW
jgi:hypothetical protein